HAICPLEIQETRREMFESLTAGAARTLRRADSLARRRGARAIEPLDLLASLAAESESRAALLLAEFGVETDRLWASFDREIADLRVELEGTEFGDDLYFMERAEEALPCSTELRQVLSEATMHAREFDRKREVGTEDLLAGLLKTEGRPADLLRSVGLETHSLLERMLEGTLADRAPLGPIQGMTPLDLSEPGGGVDLGRILDASANRAREG